ncbi:MAG: alpha-glucan phosphorylase [Candidatus Marinimicrobia bacterium]|nr:alpha-glucan phosphorylase [Candidatus Neomarinimicrobiota bacterium]|tara:strand:- start:5686 stop:7329 length:1644 start_codon:yes stop_codon:yes gene_type:complete
MNKQFEIAYFSAEIGISSSIPTYSGGLGVLAGDHIKAAGDAGISMCAITLLYKEGYFKQRLDEEGVQTETYPRFDPDPLIKQMDLNFSIQLRNRKVFIQVFKFEYVADSGDRVPIFFLDTDTDKNIDEDRFITHRLYSGDKDHRILQESVLGFGGIKLLQKLEQNSIKTYHMNEGHCSFLVLSLLRHFKGDADKVKSLCHFTTHTPVPAGHDHFSLDRTKNILNDLIPDDMVLPSIEKSQRLHMTELGLHFSRSANGVSELHGDVAQNQFPWASIGFITNGVHHSYWMGTTFKNIFDKYLPGWRLDPDKLLEIDSVPDQILLEAHLSRKKRLLTYANSQTGKALDMETLTIGFARRSATYKRAQLLFNDLEKLRLLGHKKIQIIYSGKAHPKDTGGKELIRQIVTKAKSLFGSIKIIYLENYDMWLGRLITSGVDVWLNTPLRPNEASGTSGMKATLNGVPNLSILDGWWAEGCDHKVNGWAIGDPNHPDDQKDAEHLYYLLENQIIPMFYDNKKKWIGIMKQAIKTGVRFTAFRMINEYKNQYYKV